MTLLSIYGLGFQLLIIAIMLPAGFIEYHPFFIIYTLFIFVIIGIRKQYLRLKLLITKNLYHQFKQYITSDLNNLYESII
jgi:hypothetical protein